MAAPLNESIINGTVWSDEAITRHFHRRLRNYCLAIHWVFELFFERVTIFVKNKPLAVSRPNYVGQMFVHFLQKHMLPKVDMLFHSLGQWHALSFRNKKHSFRIGRKHVSFLLHILFKSKAH